MKQKRFEWFMDMNHLAPFGLMIAAAGVLQIAASVLGWQGVPTTLASNCELMSLIVFFGTLGYGIGKII